MARSPLLHSSILFVILLFKFVSMSRLLFRLSWKNYQGKGYKKNLLVKNVM